MLLVGQDWLGRCLLVCCMYLVYVIHMSIAWVSIGCTVVPYMFAARYERKCSSTSNRGFVKSKNMMRAVYDLHQHMVPG